MNVDWGLIKDVLNVAGIIGGFVALLLVMYLRKFFAERKELENYLNKDQLELTYVAKKSFRREMHRLRTDLQSQLGASAAHTDRLLREGFAQLRDDINGQSTRIDQAKDLATAAGAKADGSLELLRRTEADFGRLDEKIDGMSDRLNGISESLGHIKGFLDKKS